MVFFWFSLDISGFFCDWRKEEILGFCLVVEFEDFRKRGRLVVGLEGVWDKGEYLFSDCILIFGVRSLVELSYLCGFYKN